MFDKLINEVALDTNITEGIAANLSELMSPSFNDIFKKIQEENGSILPGMPGIELFDSNSLESCKSVQQIDASQQITDSITQMMKGAHEAIGEVVKGLK